MNCLLVGMAKQTMLAKLSGFLKNIKLANLWSRAAPVMLDFLRQKSIAPITNCSLRRQRHKEKKAMVGSWYYNEKYQNSSKFSVTIIQEALAGRVTQREAMQLLGIKKDTTFRKYAKSLEGGVEWPIY